MLKKICKLMIIAIGFLLFTQGVSAQYNIDYLKAVGAEEKEVFTDTAAVEDGYVVVGITDSEDFLGLTNNGGIDSYIIKYNEDGEIVWKKKYDKYDNETFTTVIKTKDNGFLVGGYGSTQESQRISYSAYSKALLVKYDASGNMQWEITFGVSGESEFCDVIEVTDGYIVVGYTTTEGLEGFDGNDGNFMGVIAKYSFNGELVWAKSYKEEFPEIFKSVTQLANKELAVLGNNYSGETKLIRYTENGSFIKDTILEENSTGYSIYNSLNDIVIVGNRNVFKKDRLLNEQMTPENFSFIAKYDSDGKKIWKTEYTKKPALFFSLSLLSNGNFLVSGGISNITRAAEESNSNMEASLWIYEPNGNLVYEKEFGGNDNDCFLSATEFKNGIIAVGVTQSKNIEGYVNNLDGLLLKISIPEPEKYTITVEETKNGTIASSHSTSVQNTEITLTISPEENYKLDKIKILNAITKQEVTNSLNYKDGKFTMPDYDVIVVGYFIEELKPGEVENPETGAILPTILIPVLIVSSGLALMIRKKYFYKI